LSGTDRNVLGKPTLNNLLNPRIRVGIFYYIRPPNSSHLMPQHHFKSKVKHDDKVSVCFDGENIVAIGWIDCVHFYEGQTKYDIVDRYPDGSKKPLMANVDSNYVKEIIEPRSGL